MRGAARAGAAERDRDQAAHFGERSNQALQKRLVRHRGLSLQRENRATSSTCGVWRNWSTGLTPSIR